ncbi:MAG: aspartate aminotransferase family protein [bacterium]|nr:aspartate aminotransferase family protein [bacterium]
MRELLEDAATRAIRYLEDLPGRSVAPTPEAVARLGELDIPLPDNPTDAREVIRLLDEIGSPATLATAGPRFFGWVIGGSVPAAVASNWLATAWDQNTGLFAAAPTATVLEEIARKWLLELLGLPTGSGICFVTGATMANFTALASARDATLRKVGWDAAARGLFGAPEIQVVVSAEAHPSVTKALGMLGLGRERIVRVPTDDQGRMRSAEVPEICPPAIVCLQAGNLNTGAFDPAPEIVELAKAGGAWVHVDGAFGLWTAACPELAHLMEGFEQADSWATDAHKWLNVPCDSGLGFVRDPENLKAAMSVSAAYLPIGDHREPSMYVPELSRRARGVDIYAALRSLGRSGVAEIVRRDCVCGRRMADGLREAGYQVLNDVVLNQILVSFGSVEETRRVVEAVQREGTCWCGGTVWQGKTAMRISVCSWRTTEADAEASLQAILKVAHSASS